MSASTEMITINPNNIEESKKEQVAKKMSEILEIDYEKTFKKVKKEIALLKS